jgi:hypothetical protein
MEYKCACIGWSGFDSWHGRIFLPQHPYWLQGLPNFLSSGYQGCFVNGKVTRAWTWPLTTIWCQGYECMELHLYPSICLRGAVLIKQLLHLLHIDKYAAYWKMFLMKLLHLNAFCTLSYVPVFCTIRFFFQKTNKEFNYSFMWSTIVVTLYQ